MKHRLCGHVHFTLCWTIIMMHWKHTLMQINAKGIRRLWIILMWFAVMCTKLWKFMEMIRDYCDMIQNECCFNHTWMLNFSNTFQAIIIIYLQSVNSQFWCYHKSQPIDVAFTLHHWFSLFFFFLIFVL